MMGERFTRTRELSPLGRLPVFLLAWAHVGAQPLRYGVCDTVRTLASAGDGALRGQAPRAGPPTSLLAFLTR